MLTRLHRSEEGRISGLTVSILAVVGIGIYLVIKYVPLYIEFMDVKKQVGEAAQRAITIETEEDSLQWFDGLQQEAGRDDWINSRSIFFRREDRDTLYAGFEYEVEVVHPIGEPHLLVFSYYCRTSGTGCEETEPPRY